ncbi:MAG: hypothetical protein U5R46_00460 [Gammaproteobacteria bacterium]|nr:hypothetical protein [Gammaproteobacteria bacterium]
MMAPLSRFQSSARPRAILHIGTEKTGTTTIQQFLAKNRSQLLKKGVLVPASAENKYHNHIKLVAYARADDRQDNLRRSLGIENERDLERFRYRFRSELEREIKTAGRNAQTVVLSSEHCHSRLTSAAEVERLVDLLRPLVEDLAIVVYLRRQDKMAVSLYSTYLKLGGTGKEVFPKTATESHSYYNLDGLLDRWARVCGEPSIIPRIYEPVELKEGDTVRDFLELIGPYFGSGPIRVSTTDERDFHLPGAGNCQGGQ